MTICLNTLIGPDILIMPETKIEILLLEPQNSCPLVLHVHTHFTGYILYIGADRCIDYQSSNDRTVNTITDLDTALGS